MKVVQFALSANKIAHLGLQNSDCLIKMLEYNIIKNYELI